MENELISTKELEELIIARKVKEVRNIFEVVPTIDIAEACDDFEDQYSKSPYIIPNPLHKTFSDPILPLCRNQSAGSPLHPSLLLTVH